MRLLKKGPRGDLQENLEQMTGQQRNSFIHIRNWVKGEVISLAALQNAIGYKDMVNKFKDKCRAEIESLNDAITKLNAGKFTFGGMFKNSSEKQNSAAQKTAMVAELEKDILNYDIIKRYLTIYLATAAIPAYKK